MGYTIAPGAARASLVRARKWKAVNDLDARERKEAARKRRQRERILEMSREQKYGRAWCDNCEPIKTSQIGQGHVNAYLPYKCPDCRVRDE